MILCDSLCLSGEEKINNKKVKIRNKEVVAPSIPQRGKLQSLRVFASLRALRETHSCNFVPSRLRGEEKINNKKVKNKEVWQSPK